MGIKIEKLSVSGRNKLKESEVGLEKETLRVDANGFMAHTLHPFPNDAHIEKDFCENQVEMITGVSGNVHDAWQELRRLHNQIVRSLADRPSGPEYLWPFSNPPYLLGEDDIPIARYEGALADKEVYRKYLAEKYGKKKMVFSGIHFNFSFPEDLLREDFQNSDEKTFRAYKDGVYMDLAGKILKYSWLIVYLTAASPILDGSYRDVNKRGITIRSRYASPRCSEIGYWNKFLPALDFSSLRSYVDSIQRYVDEGQLRQSSELYYPVRLKPKGENSNQNLIEHGVNHIELRMLDLNPLDEAGIDERDLQFIVYLLLYLSAKPKEMISISEQIIAIRNMKNAALFDENEIRIELEWLNSRRIQDAAEDILDDMKQFLYPILGEEIGPVMDFQKKKVQDPSCRYARIIAKKYETHYVETALAQMREYPFWGWKNAFAFAECEDYPGIRTPRDLYSALQHVWTADTCAPRMRNNWTEKNRTLGQCSITAFLVQDIFGGEVKGVLRPAGNYHCFNVTKEGAFDLTSEQFGEEVLNYENCPVQSRETHFRKEEKRKRYEQLKQNLRIYLQSKSPKQIEI